MSTKRTIRWNVESAEGVIIVPDGLRSEQIWAMVKEEVLETAEMAFDDITDLQATTRRQYITDQKP
jgi:hypothetical protein